MNCKGKLIDLSTPKVMGILNVTPNSFYDGGKFENENSILIQVEKMLHDGATIIDVGGFSSKPGTLFISEKLELKRVVSVVELIIKKYPNTLISIDTFRSEVARICIECGASIINDISAGFLDKKMMQVIANKQVVYVMMHMKGNIKNMHILSNYENIIKEILLYLSKKIALARDFGIIDLIIDPGFGFAKTLNQNYEILKKLQLLNILELPILVGLSRKSMIYKILNTNPDKSLNGTTALNIFALLNGVKILRVHDVKEAIECISLHKSIG